MKAYRRHRGVAIYRTATPLPGATFHADGKPRKPKKEDVLVTFAYTDGYPCDTVSEVIEMIDGVFEECKAMDIDDATIVASLNSEED